MNVVANSKGRIVIPSKIRYELGIKAGTCLQVDVNIVTRQIILTPITHEFIHNLRGKYKGRGLMKALINEKRLEV